MHQSKYTGVCWAGMPIDTGDDIYSTTKYAKHTKLTKYFANHDRATNRRHRGRLIGTDGNVG